MQTNIDSIYRTHIQPLSKEEQLQLLAEMAKRLALREDNFKRPEKRSIMELHGLGAEIWKGIDPDEYVNSLRDEWESRS